MKKKTVSAEEKEDKIRVKLKPVWGIHPHTYLSVLYSLAIFGALFFLLVFPGLINSGSIVRIDTVPEGASIYADGVRIGFSPAEVFLPRGQRRLSVRKPFFETSDGDIQIPGRIFGTLLWKKKTHISVSLKLKDPRGLLEEAHKEFSSWTLSGEPNLNFQFPLPLSEAVIDYTLAAGGDSLPVWEFIASSAGHVNSPGALKDFVRAALLTGSEGRSLSPQGFVRSLDRLLGLYGTHELTSFWLTAVLPDSAANVFSSSGIISREIEAYSVRLKSGLKQPLEPVSGPATVRIAGREFSRVPGGTFFQGWAGLSDTSGPRDSLIPPFETTVKPFFLQTREVTEGEYADFIKANPRWAPSGRENLVKDNLADSSYLASWNNSEVPPRPAYPVREVSYFAAQAYCEWLTASNKNYNFFLPEETQWEWAASLNMSSLRSSQGSLKPAGDGEGGKIGLRYAEGNVWEWCSDWFAPVSYVFSGIKVYPGVEKVVRGGAWINPEGTITVSTRASQPPTWCTPYLGFRVAAKGR
jgi:formylglycine-generating enzyme required for sulfatase activity